MNNRSIKPPTLPSNIEVIRQPDEIIYNQKGFLLDIDSRLNSMKVRPRLIPE